MTSSVARSVSSSRMRTSVGPETEATTLTGPKEKDALASALASVPSSADRARSAVGEVLLEDFEEPAFVDIDDAIFAVVLARDGRLVWYPSQYENLANVNAGKVEILGPSSEFFC